MKIYTSAQMKQIEANANEKGYAYIDMMYSAGVACANLTEKAYLTMNEKVAVICGKGKNGGDGFVAAEYLRSKGYNVSVILACGKPVADDAVTMYRRMNGISVTDWLTEKEKSSEIIRKADVIIDSVFGFGFKGKADDSTAEIFAAVNSSKAKVVAIDLPSGAECDTGAVNGECIKADLTLAISCRKPAHVLKPACSFCGKVKTVDIGLDESAVQEEFFVLPKSFKPNFERRNPLSNKGDYGKVLSVCGSKKYPGAAFFAASGAVRIGAGLVTCAFPVDAYSAIAPKLNEPIMMPLPCCEDGFLARGALDLLIPAAEISDCMLVGCGLGNTLGTSSVVEELLKSTTCPTVIDADGINIISANINMLEAVRGRAIITPHPGEMARLLRLSVEQVESNRILLTKAVAKQFGIVVVLKGANTVVSDGEQVYVNRTGNAGMARGGSGDLLAGIIAGLVAQGYSAMQSAMLGTYIHGACGDVAAKTLSEAGMTPTDMIKILPRLLSDYE
ncbi:MAG: NAD(P)H-hydrate dehydratase [Clostridia bacterium]|nr:NAD(P)H-hydrate dehydratase [Clostridia bacterium]